MPLLFAAHYRHRKALWFTYIINSVSVLLSMVLGFFYGICDLNLLFEGSHKRDWYLTVVASGTGYSFNSDPVFVLLVFGVLPRCMILLVITFMLQDIVLRSSEDELRIAQLTYLKETDSGTKVFNKNKYEEMVKTYYPYIDNIRAIFWDLNNLKMINDTYGHDYGDKAIERLSSVLYSFVDERRRVYRIGGDEFIMIIEFVLLVFGVLPRCLILLVITFMLQDIVLRSSEDELRIAQLTYLKETDSGTKVFNKNKYEEMVKTYYPYIDNIRAIFWDLNNLKMINDTYGHDYGDKAIERLSSVLYSFVDERRRVYRIGGDEFIMIIDNPSDEEGKNISASVAEMIEKANEGSRLKITSAVGIAKGYGRDVLEVVKRADEEMYKNKVKSKAGR